MTKIRANDFESVVKMVSPIRDPKGLCIVLEDERDLLEIAQGFSGHSRLEVVDSSHDGVTIYEGYTRLTSMYRRGDTVTLVLGKVES